MRRLGPLLLVAVLTLFAGCGDSSEETTTALTRSVERQVRAGFLAKPDCKPPEGASRWGCSVGSYRCQGVVTDRGTQLQRARAGEITADECLQLMADSWNELKASVQG